MLFHEPEISSLFTVLLFAPLKASNRIITHSRRSATFAQGRSLSLVPLGLLFVVVGTCSDL